MLRPTLAPNAIPQKGEVGMRVIQPDRQVAPSGADRRKSVPRNQLANAPARQETSLV